MTKTMTVTPIAMTTTLPGAVDLLRPDVATTAADHLAEVAGRACYKSWGRPNPATAANDDYLAHIVESGHFSVLEHSSVTFYVEHVSRSLLLELERHRFLSFSVESQRYVDQVASHPEPVVPPLFRDNHLDCTVLQQEYDRAMSTYTDAYQRRVDVGQPRKQAREAARAYLPNATPVDFVVTGNLRCWRDVLAKRLHPSADAEIREFAQAVLKNLRIIAPNSVADITAEA